MTRALGGRARAAAGGRRGRCRGGTAPWSRDCARCARRAATPPRGGTAAAPSRRTPSISAVMVAAVLAGVLVVVIVAGRRPPALARPQAAALEAERARLATEGDGLATQLAERERASWTSSRPTARWSTRAEDWIWAVDERRHDHVLQPRGRRAARARRPGRPRAGRAHASRRPAVRLGRASCGAGTPTAAGARVDSRSRARRRRLAGDRPRSRRAAPRAESTPGVAVVRSPVVDGRREVIGYELIGDGSVLDGFAPAELLELGAGRPVWVGLDGDDRARARPRSGAVLQLAPDDRAERARRAGGGGLRARARRLRRRLARCSSTAGSSRSARPGATDDDAAAR